MTMKQGYWAGITLRPNAWNKNTETHPVFCKCDRYWQNQSECAQANFKLRTKKKKKLYFQVCTKMSSLSPRLAIPMLQLVIQYLKWSLFERSLRGVPFPLLVSRVTTDWHMNHAHKGFHQCTILKHAHTVYTELRKNNVNPLHDHLRPSC